jgi:hypothetical protein
VNLNDKSMGDFFDHGILIHRLDLPATEPGGKFCGEQGEKRLNGDEMNGKI